MHRSRVREIFFAWSLFKGLPALCWIALAILRYVVGARPPSSSPGSSAFTGAAGSCASPGRQP